MATRRQVALAYQIALPHMERINRGILDYARQHDPWEFSFSPEASLVSLESLIHWKGHGVLAMVELPRQLKLARRLRCPVVNVAGSLVGHELPTVISDNHAIGRQAAEHLLARGFRRFGYYGLVGVGYSIGRQEGFARRLAEAGQECSLLLTTSSLQTDRPWEWNRRELDKWLRGRTPPIGILAVHDYRARIIIEACHRLGIRVPEEVAVVGVGNDPVACELSNPALTSVPQDGERIGYEAARMLDQLMSRRKPQTTTVAIPPPPLIFRASTDALGIDHPLLKQAIDCIRDQLATNLNVQSLCRQLRVSRRWLETIFRDQLHCSPLDYIIRQRVRRASELLLADRRRQLSDIARASGFRDSRRMSLAFRKVLSKTPRQCREEVSAR